ELFGFLSGYSPLERAVFFHPEGKPPPSRMTEADRAVFTPELTGETLLQKSLDVRVVTEAQFTEFAAQLKDKGIWIVFTPSPGFAQVQVGHFNVLVGGEMFSRNLDGD